jgi:MinD-like ATPase involved in chromosome partitioning or flagellar assembly
MKATVITMASAKGGSGKTIVTASFGTILASIGRRVLIIDTDAATNGLSLFFIKAITTQVDGAATSPVGLFESRSPTDNLTLIQLSENLDFLPATYQFRNTEATDIESYKKILRSVVTHLRAEYDFILLDAQAGSDEFAEVAISPSVSDQVVIVSEYDPMSAAGVERLKALFSESLTYRRTWILLNKMLPEFIKSFSDFMEIAKYLSPLPWSAEVVRAYARRAMPLDLEIGNGYTLAAVQTLRSLIDDDTRADLDGWLDGRTSELRDPVKSQLDEARSNLSTLRRQRHEFKRRRQLRLTSVVFTILLIGIIGGVEYLILTTGTLAQRISVVSGIIAVSIALGSAAALLFRSFGPSYTEIELDAEIAEVAERVRRLDELSDADLGELIRRRSTS